MKIIIYLLCCISFFACKGRPSAVQKTAIKPVITDTTIITKAKKLDTLFKPYTLVDDYIVTDTGKYDFGTGNSTYAVIKRSNKLIDTIDLNYGMQQVNTKEFMYNKVEVKGDLSEWIANPKDKKMTIAYYTDYIIVNAQNHKINVSRRALNFGYFASPAIINHQVFYWHVKEFKQTNQISAAVFNPETLTSKSYYLQDEALETDADGYFPQPFLIKDTVVFEIGSKQWKFSPSFKFYK